MQCARQAFNHSYRPQIWVRSELACCGCFWSRPMSKSTSSDPQQPQQLRCYLHVKQPKCYASSVILPPITRSRSRTSRGSWSAPSVRSSSPTRWSFPASTASATSVSGSCWCSTMRTPSTPALSAPCRAAPGPGCRPPPWRGWTGLWDQVGLGVRNQNIHFSVGRISLFFFFLTGGILLRTAYCAGRWGHTFHNSVWRH